MEGRPRPQLGAGGTEAGAGSRAGVKRRAARGWSWVGRGGRGRRPRTAAGAETTHARGNGSPDAHGRHARRRRRRRWKRSLAAERGGGWPRADLCGAWRGCVCGAGGGGEALAASGAGTR